ncbi:hypothetical protein [Extensimonas vulgaris]|uniref:Uncharacterized protein n=1 Tax=Extensimonas vulgaris TaxID=1031594 RepID=A0A369AMV1_9BURK|nr:hypothetical protein [Extensimonas vulgaris]MBC7215675.1 hypothetical protein [Burkholderiaceae bacterium]RCX10710.1 hypothetical protein DFR45_102111 [Extensimonas vulgaris]TWI41352.1 hypothetical protein IP95_00109 [Extensimonas vulgaris]TXD16821.1 hypothetical protein FUT63_02180 [Extensimonas vulgaris]
MKGLSYEALQLLEFLREQGPATAQDMRVVTPHLSVRHINNRLKRMADLGYIERLGREGNSRCYMLWGAVDTRLAIPQAPQFDRMHAPVYVPPRDEPAREGALDFKRCPSLFFGALVHR